MTRTILYYPTIAIRNSDWIKQSIFYWDRISSIVPRNVADQVFRFDVIKELAEYDAFMAFHPESYVNDREELAQEYINLIESEGYKKHKSVFKSRGVFPIDCGKMPKTLIKYVTDNEIATRQEDDLIFNKRDGYLYMALLAKFLSNENYGGATTPGTDYGLYQRLILDTRNDSHSLPGLSFSLDKVLPVPSPDVTIKQIMEFKKKYEKDELYEFRKIIYDYQEKLKVVQDVAELQDVLEKCSEDIQKGVKKIEKACRSQGFPTILGGLESIFRIEAPAILATMASGVAVPAEVQIGGAAVIGTVSVTKYLIDEINKNRERLANDSFSYLYHAKDEGIIDLP